jgi:hypothetical protein
MSALRETTPMVGPGNNAPGAPGRPSRRRPSAARPVGAAGAARRSAQQNLARREANLRISRRVSGPATGISRAPMADAPLGELPEFISGAQPGVAVDVHLPGWDDPLPASAPAAPQRAAAPQARPVAAPSQRPATAPQSRAAQAQPQRRMAPAPRAQGAPGPQARRMSGPAPRATQPVQRGAVLTPAAAQVASVGVASASAAVAAPSPQRLGLPLKTLTRPLFKTLPGGAQETSSRRIPRLSNAAVFVSAITLLVITVGLIVALQIRVTQVNEQRGAELSQISALQASNIAQREANSALASNTKVAGFAHGRLVQPDVEDVTFRSAGNRADMAARAAAALHKLPLNPVGGIASAKDAATGTTPGAAGTTTASAATSGAGTSIDSTVSNTAATGATGATTTPQTGAGVTP